MFNESGDGDQQFLDEDDAWGEDFDEEFFLQDDDDDQLD